MCGLDIFHGDSVAWPWNAVVAFGTLGQLHKFAAEDIVQPQLSGDFLGNIQMMGPPRLNVVFLKNKNIRVRIAKKIDDCPEL